MTAALAADAPVTAPTVIPAVTAGDDVTTRAAAAAGRREPVAAAPFAAHRAVAPAVTAPQAMPVGDMRATPAFAAAMAGPEMTAVIPAADVVLPPLPAPAPVAAPAVTVAVIVMIAVVAVIPVPAAAVPVTPVPGAETAGHSCPAPVLAAALSRPEMTPVVLAANPVAALGDLEFARRHRLSG